MSQLPSRRHRALRLFYVLFVILFGLFHYVVHHYHHVPGGRSYVDWSARGLAFSLAEVAIGLWIIVWLNKRYSK